ncbi:MAG: WbqC family protein [Bacteroidia bacterium]|nr:WbqC family protein [Bacteroidia bacterium]
MNVLLHPTYFPSIAHFVALVKADSVTFEVEGNYQKQTYRNRTYIYGANGKLLLNVPVKHSHKSRQKYKDVKIANDENWQDLHWKSLKSAYRTSPFFEFYEDDFIPLFEKKHRFILDYNFECLELVLETLQLGINYTRTTKYFKDVAPLKDYRYLVNARKETPFQFDKYTQVFINKHGFISNLSILDLLFNEGTNALNYLQSQELDTL